MCSLCFLWSSVVVVVMAAMMGYYYQYNKPSDIYLYRELNSTYDYIIVGAGSAGSVVANRLSEDKDTTVLLVEAGGSELGILEVEMPAGFFALQRSEHDWKYYTEPQKHAAKTMREERSYWPRGKILGGTSNLNTMVYIRGSRHDYDEWSKEGCDGWSYKDVLPYFIKAEDFLIEEYADSDYHGKGGNMKITENVITPLRDIFMSAAEEVGYKTVDCNGRDMIGFCKMQASVRRGQRWSTAKAYLRPVMERQNLHISVKSFVTKVSIENKRAVGIELIKDGVKKRIMANKEVIVSAGSVNSPQLLMLSGIGPKNHLEELNIPMHSDLPVGSNLQDHINLLVPVKINESFAIDIAKATSLKTLLEFFLLGKGYLASIPFEGTLFAHSTKGDKSSYPDIQLHFLSIEYNKDGIKKYNIANLKKEVIDMHQRTNGDISLYIIPTILHPKSKGTIRLKTTDPFDHPSIDPNYLEQNVDVEVFIEAVRLVQKLIQTEMFKRYDGKVVNLEKLVPVCDHIPYNTDKYWECFVRNHATTGFHPTSTCRMGGLEDFSAVVDPQLRVKGISGLRVVDASVMRNAPSGNTNAPSIMIGEKASDMIRGIDTVAEIRSKVKNLENL